MELAHQATEVSLSKDQAANAAAQSTLDYNQRRLMELSIRGTEVSQNMAWAAATQEFIAEQTQVVWNATGTAQSQAATATYSAYSFYVSQTAQAHSEWMLMTTQIAQVNETQAAQSLTATPLAAIQSEITRARNESDRRALWGEFVVTPLIVILTTLVVLLLIAGGVLAYQRLMPVLELRLRTISRYNDSLLLLDDGIIVDLDARQQGLSYLKNDRFSMDNTPRIEIVDPDEPSVTNWVTEAEQKLRTGGTVQR
jgi:hypothetical protein